MFNAACHVRRFAWQWEIRCPRGKKNVQDWINLVCGVLLFISPWALRFSGDPVAARTAWVGGIVIGVMAIAALVQFAEWEEWVDAHRRPGGRRLAVGPRLRRDALRARGLRGAGSHRRARFDLGNLGRPSSRDDGQVSWHDGADRLRQAGGPPFFCPSRSLDAAGAFAWFGGTPRIARWSLSR